MDRKLSRVVLAGLLSSGACQCHAQVGWGWGKSDSPAAVSTTAPERTALDWRPAPQASHSTQNSQTGSPFAFPQPTNNAGQQYPTAQSSGIEWNRLPASNAANSQSLPPNRSQQAARSLWDAASSAPATQLAPQTRSTPQTRTKQGSYWDSETTIAPVVSTGSSPRSFTLQQPELPGHAGIEPFGLIETLPAMADAPGAGLTPNETVESAVAAVPLSARVQPVVAEVSAARLNEPSAVQPVTRGQSGVEAPSGARVLPNAAKSVHAGIIGPSDDVTGLGGSQRTALGAEHPAPLADSPAFGLIESYRPSPSVELPSTPFTLPSVEQVVPPPSQTNPTTIATTTETPVEATQQVDAAAMSLIPMELKNLEASPSDRGNTAPENTLANQPTVDATGTGAYVLQDLRGGAANPTLTATVVPIDILPMNRLAVAPQLSVEEKLSTEKMTGPLTDPSMMFAKLNVENDFRQLPSTVGSNIRGNSMLTGDQWSSHAFAWVTPTFYHRPLYFEQENLERYGIGSSRYTQPAYSAAHFFMSIGLMPYKLTTQHPCEKVYTLGHNRPGDCVPYQRRSLLGQSYPMEACRYFESYSSYR